MAHNIYLMEKRLNINVILGFKRRTMNEPVTLLIKSDYLLDKLSINEWNALITSYENDPNVIMEDHMDDYILIHTTVDNIKKNHNINDLRFRLK